MPSPIEWIGLLGGGAVAKSAVDALLVRRKTKADAHKSDAEGDLAEASAAEKLAQTALTLVEEMRGQLGTVQHDLEAHKLADAQARAARLESAREHMKWDKAAAEQIRALGGDIPDPPPLYEGGDCP